MEFTVYEDERNLCKKYNDIECHSAIQFSELVIIEYNS